MGLRSGEDGGTERRVAPCASLASRTPSTVWRRRLSAMMISPGCSVGPKNSRLYPRNASPSIAPSRNSGALTAPTRRPALQVVVFQCPCGTEATQRSPTGARPRVRVMVVETPVSSRNTSCVTSSAGWCAGHSARSAFTSSRSCSLACRVFFKAHPPRVELMPERRGFYPYAVCPQAFADLGTRQVCSLFDPRPDVGVPVRHA
jgi:hypothetical protein